MKTLKVLFIVSIAILSIGKTAIGAVKNEAQHVKGYRFEVLVYSCQIRLIEITDSREKIRLIVPAMTAKKDRYVPFDKKSSIRLIKVNPSWTPTTAMHKEEPGSNRSFKGGDSDNPLGFIAFYPKFKGSNFVNIRIHQAPEITNRQLARDENGNLQGYRESHGCASVSQKDIVKFTHILTDIKESKIRRMISLHKTKVLRPMVPATMIFLRE